jgi:hypothetical protein
MCLREKERLLRRRDAFDDVLYKRLPDADPILRREIHGVALGDAAEVQKVIELLQRCS